MNASREVEGRWEAIRRAVESELSGDDDVACRIPGWQPTDLATGLWWLRARVYEGFYVDFTVVREGDSTMLWVKEWEYGDPEPDWESVMAIPAKPADPDQAEWDEMLRDAQRGASGSDQPS